MKRRELNNSRGNKKTLPFLLLRAWMGENRSGKGIDLATSLWEVQLTSLSQKKSCGKIYGNSTEF